MSLPVWAVDCSSEPAPSEITSEQTITVSGTCAYGQGEELVINAGTGKSVTLQGNGSITATGESDNYAIILVKSGLLTLQEKIEVSSEAAPRVYGIHLLGKSSALVINDATIRNQGGAVLAKNSGSITVSGKSTLEALDGLLAVLSGDITVSDSRVEGKLGYGIKVQLGSDITLSGSDIKGKMAGVYIFENSEQKHPSKLTILGNTSIRPVAGSSQFTLGAIIFIDADVFKRNILDLATNPDNIQGLVLSRIDKDGLHQLQNTNTLTLSGEENQSLNLTEFGTIGDNATDYDATWDDNEWNIQLSEAAKTKGRKFFAFDTITKEGSGTWTLTGELTKGIIKANKDDGTQSPGILVNAGTLAIAPNAIVNVESLKEDNQVKVTGIQVAGGTLELGNNTQINSDIVVDKAGTLYAKAGTQTVDSLVLNGTFQADIHGDNYTQIRSKGDITIGGDASLVINTAHLTDADGISFKNILASATKIYGQFGSVSSNSRLFDFTAEYDKQSTDTVKAVHLLATAKPVTPEPTPEPTPTPEPAPSIGLVENIVNKAGDSVVSPVARTLDRIFAQEPMGRLASQFFRLTTDAQVVNAVEQIQPLLGIRTSRVIMEATDTLTKAIPTGHCLAGAGDNQVWAKVLGEWNEREGSSGLSGYQATHSGIAVGSERCVTENTKLGLTAGYIKTDADSYDSAANHNLKADTWQIGVYGNTALTPQWDIDFYAGIGQAYLDGKRHLSFLGRTAESEMKANHFRTGITLNRAFQINSQAKVTPFIGLDYQRVEVEDYIEKGAKDFNFAVDKQSTEAFMAKLGIKGDFQVNEKLSLQAKAAVGYDMSYRGNYLRAGFVNYPKYRFTLEECDPSRVKGELDVGAKYQISQNVVLGAGVQSTFAKGFNSVAGNVNLSIQF